MITHKITLTRCTWINATLSLLAALILSACATAGDTMPQGGPTMVQMYEEAMQQSNVATLDQARTQIASPQNYNGTTNLSAYTRTTENETNNLFPLLPNPQVVMYIYPHLAGQDEAPVPGYSTAFTLFEKEHYAMTNEVNAL